MSDESLLLRFVSNVIELKPDKKYLLVFKGGEISGQEIDQVCALLQSHGFYSIGLALRDGQELDVIEVPANE